MTTMRLDDTWHRRDLPVLIAAARILDIGGQVTPDELAVAEGLDIAPELVELACEALFPTYVTAGRSPRRGGDIRGGLVVTGLTDAGRRATGLWPDGDTALEQLLSALRQAEDLVDDPDDKSALRKAGGQLASVSRGVITEVIASVIAKQSGLS